MSYGDCSDYRISKIVKYLNSIGQTCRFTQEYRLPNKIYNGKNKWRDYAIGKIRLKVKIDGVADYELININKSPSRLNFGSQDKVIEQLEEWL